MNDGIYKQILQQGDKIHEYNGMLTKKILNRFMRDVRGELHPEITLREWAASHSTLFAKRSDIMNQFHKSGATYGTVMQATAGTVVINFSNHKPRYKRTTPIIEKPRTAKKWILK